MYTTLSDPTLSRICTTYKTSSFTLAGYTCAVIGSKRNGEYAVVDSHSGSADGMVDDEGKSVVVYFSSLQHLIQHFQHFADSLQTNDKRFEISGIELEKEPFSLGDGAAVDCTEAQVTAPTEDSPGTPVVPAATKSSEKRELPPRKCTPKRMKVSEPEGDSDIVCVGDAACKILLKMSLWLCVRRWTWNQREKKPRLLLSGH